MGNKITQPNLMTSSDVRSDKTSYELPEALLLNINRKFFAVSGAGPDFPGLVISFELKDDGVNILTIPLNSKSSSLNKHFLYRQKSDMIQFFEPTAAPTDDWIWAVKQKEGELFFFEMHAGAAPSSIMYELGSIESILIKIIPNTDEILPYMSIFQICEKFHNAH